MFDTTVAEVLASKGCPNVWTLPSDAGIWDAIRLMHERSIGSVVVINRERVVGVVCERDCLFRLNYTAHDQKNLTLADLLETTVSIVNRKTTVRECFSIMAAQHVRYLPVVENNHLIGLVSIGDIVRAFVDEQRFTIDQLLTYVNGSYGSSSHHSGPWHPPRSNSTRITAVVVGNE